MKQVSRNKQFGFKRFIASINNSIDGLKYAYANEQSMFLHGIFTLFSIVLGNVLKISITEWIIITALLCVIAVIELLNTAIEATCDAITKEYNPLIKIAKDTSSASAFLASIVTIGVEIAIFVPLIMKLF